MPLLNCLKLSLLLIFSYTPSLCFLELLLLFLLLLLLLTITCFLHLPRRPEHSFTVIFLRLL
jgi:hypothetical protein